MDRLTLWISVPLILIVVAVAMAAIFLQPSEEQQVLQQLERFEQYIKDDYIYDSYQLIAARLQKVSFAGYEESLADYGFDGDVDIDWKVAMYTGSEVTSTGNVKFADGNEDLLTLNLVREGGSWKIYSLVSRRVGLFIRENVTGVESGEDLAANQNAVLPDEGELKKLAVETIQRFNEAIQIEFFGPFYQQISQAWQQQTAPAKLLAVFDPFIQKEVRLPGLRQAEVTFLREPEINEFNLLILNGTINSEQYGYVVFFESKYAFEAGQWKLFGIDISHRAE